jgi:hypothetical protein
MTAGSHSPARHTNVGEEPLSAIPLGSVFRLPPPPWSATACFPARPRPRTQARGRPTKIGMTANAPSVTK